MDSGTPKYRGGLYGNVVGPTCQPPQSKCLGFLLVARGPGPPGPSAASSVSGLGARRAAAPPKDALACSMFVSQINRFTRMRCKPGGMPVLG